MLNKYTYTYININLFYSKAKIAKKNAIENAKSELEEYQKKLDKNLEIIKKEKVGKENTKERQILLDKLKNIQEEKLKLESQVKILKASDSENYEEMKKNIEVNTKKLLLYCFI